MLDVGGAIAPPEGPPDWPVYDVQGDGGEPWPDWRGPVAHAWGAVYDFDPETGEPAREYLGRGRLIGWLHRERAYLDHGAGMKPHFEVRGELVEATAGMDVALPIVEAEDGNRYLPEYPRCPDCGGRIAWAEGGRVSGSRRCEGATAPDLPAAGMAADPPGVASEPDGCGSTFVDSRYGYAAPVPGSETDSADDAAGDAADHEAGDDLIWTDAALRESIWSEPFDPEANQ